MPRFELSSCQQMNSGFVARHHEEDDHEVTVLSYSLAEIRAALERPRDYVRAVQELRACILKFYRSRAACKALRRVIEEDVRRAVMLCDKDRYRNQAARTELIRAMDRCFPGKVVQDIKRQQRRREVEQSKLVAKGKAEQQAARADRPIERLPLEVLLKVFGLLDPLSLASCMVVSRQWHATASDEGLWRRLFEATAGGRVRQGDTALPPRDCFCDYVTTVPASLRAWQSGRRLRGGLLGWEETDMENVGRTSPAETPSVDRVVRILQYGKVAADTTSSDSSEDEADSRLAPGWRLWNLNI